MFGVGRYLHKAIVVIVCIVNTCIQCTYDLLPCCVDGKMKVENKIVAPTECCGCGSNARIYKALVSKLVLRTGLSRNLRIDSGDVGCVLLFGGFSTGFLRINIVL